MEADDRISEEGTCVGSFILGVVRVGLSRAAWPWRPRVASRMRPRGGFAGTADSASGGKVYACVTARFHTLNLSSAGATCPNGEQKIFWNVQGKRGLRGARGARGSTGLQGLQGSVGAPGAPGAQGAKGNTGATGAQGAKGNTGATGATGSQGAKGDTGATGAQGSKGTPARRQRRACPGWKAPADPLARLALRGQPGRPGRPAVSRART